MKSTCGICISMGPVKVTKRCVENRFIEFLRYYQLSLESCRGPVTFQVTGKGQTQCLYFKQMQKGSLEIIGQFSL